jgi:hypothetical protein
MAHAHDSPGRGLCRHVAVTASATHYAADDDTNRWPGVAITSRLSDLGADADCNGRRNSFTHRISELPDTRT